MTASRRPAPVVRVSDPRAPQVPPQAAPSSASPAPGVPDGPAPERAAGRRRALPLVLLLVGLAVGAGASELRHAQRDRAAEALGAGVLDLRLEEGQEFGGVEVHGNEQGVVLRRPLAVRNVGGRAVRVLDATLVGGAMRGGSARDLPHGEAWRLVLSGPVRCSGGPPAYAPPGSLLRIRAETAAGPRSLELPLPASLQQELQSQAERSCGVVPPEEAVQAEPTDVDIGDERATLDVQTYVRSSDPVDLLRVDGGRPGLRVAVRAGGRPPVFPFRLDSGGTWPRVEGQPSPSSRVQLVVTVEDCRRLREPAALPLGDAPLARLVLQVAGATGELHSDVYDPGVVQPLVDQNC